MPRKVLHCVAGNLYGGVESFLATLARNRRLVPDLEPEFALCFGGILADQIREAGVAPHMVGPARYSRPWTVLGVRNRFRALIAETRPDAVICHACWPHSIFAPSVRRAGLPLVFWMHDAVGGTSWPDRFARPWPPDLVLANSLYTASTLPNLFPRSPCQVLAYPVEPAPAIDREATRRAVRQELGTGLDASVLLVTCRFERWKGHTLLLDALGRLARRPDWILWVAGGAQRPHEQVYLDELKAQARRLGIADRVLWLGQRSDVRRLLAAADLHTQTNTGPEPFGIAFVEALYAGLPVVSTRMGGAAEIVDPTCGVLVDPDDPEALAEALASLLDDPSRRALLSAGGPPRASLLSDAEQVMGRLLASLEGVISGQALAAAAPPRSQPVENVQ